MPDGAVSENAGLIGGLGVGILGVVTWALRMLNSQRATNRQEAAAEAVDAGQSTLVQHLQGEIERLTKAQSDLTERVDKMAAERNDAKEKLATSQAQALVLQSKMEALEASVAELKEELRAVEDDRDRAWAEVRLLKNEGNARNRRIVDIDDRDRHEA